MWNIQYYHRFPTLTETAERGKFYGQFSISPLNKKQWKTDYTFYYVTKQGKIIEIPEGTVTDGLSIPRILWFFLGHPFQPIAAPAAVAHDYECKEKKDSSKEVHDRFYEMLLVRNFNKTKSWLYWKGVKLFGPKFKRAL